MFINLFEMEGAKVKEILNDDLRTFREKLNQLFEAMVKKDEYALRLTIRNRFLERIMFKTTTGDADNLITRFEEIRELIQDFRNRFEDLDYSEDALEKGEEQNMSDLEEYIRVISDAINGISNNVGIAEKLRRLEHHNTKG